MWPSTHITLTVHEQAACSTRAVWHYNWHAVVKLPLVCVMNPLATSSESDPLTWRNEASITAPFSLLQNGMKLHETVHTKLIPEHLQVESQYFFSCPAGKLILVGSLILRPGFWSFSVCKNGGGRPGPSHEWHQCLPACAGCFKVTPHLKRVMLNVEHKVHWQD